MVFRREDLFSFLVPLYFICSFFWITYEYNIYIVVSFVLFFLLLFWSGLWVFVFSFLVLFICFFYFYVGGVWEAYRFFKTFLVFFPVVCICRYYQLDSSFVLDFFLKFCVLLVFFEFIFFLIFGFGFMPDTVATYGEGFLFLRYRAVFEDSNFFSYVILTYIFYKKIVFGRYDLLFIAALFLSLSVSAIVFFLSLVIFYFAFDFSGILRRYLRVFFAVLLAVVFYFYFYLVVNWSGLLGGIESEFWQFKLVSLSIRFDLQGKAIEYLLDGGGAIWGVGAGSARLLSEGGFNLHNSYLQILFEMGFISIFFVLCVLIYLFLKINIRFIPVYSAVVLLGLVMEVYYFPLLFFVFYLSNLIPREV